MDQKIIHNNFSFLPDDEHKVSCDKCNQVFDLDDGLGTLEDHLVKHSIFYCNVPEMEKQIAKEEFIDRLDRNEEKLVKEMTKNDRMSEFSARNQIWWGDRVKQHASLMIKEGYNMTLEDGIQWAKNWGAIL